jgi:hypothetical protein
MHKILVIRLYFPLYALHVSDYISSSSGATFISCTSYLVHAGTIRLARGVRALKLITNLQVVVYPNYHLCIRGVHRRS